MTSENNQIPPRSGVFSLWCQEKKCHCWTLPSIPLAGIENGASDTTRQCPHEHTDTHAIICSRFKCLSSCLVFTCDERAEM